MQEYERRYNYTDGSSLENELSRLLSRYANEGRPEHLAPSGEGRKQVRFEPEDAIE